MNTVYMTMLEMRNPNRNIDPEQLQNVTRLLPFLQVEIYFVDEDEPSTFNIYNIFTNKPVPSLELKKILEKQEKEVFDIIVFPVMMQNDKVAKIDDIAERHQNADDDDYDDDNDELGEDAIVEEEEILLLQSLHITLNQYISKHLNKIKEHLQTIKVKATLINIIDVLNSFDKNDTRYGVLFRVKELKKSTSYKTISISPIIDKQNIENLVKCSASSKSVQSLLLSKKVQTDFKVTNEKEWDKKYSSSRIHYIENFLKNLKEEDNKSGGSSKTMTCVAKKQCKDGKLRNHYTIKGKGKTLYVKTRGKLIKASDLLK